MWKTWTSRHVAAGLLASALVLVETHGAFAQSVRYWNRSVDAGKQLEFSWTNYDEATCRDRGYARLIINKKPQMGRFRSAKRKVTQRNGRCKGKRFSTVFVYYVAGRKKGTDRATYTIQGGNRNNTEINLKISIK